MTTSGTYAFAPSLGDLTLVAFSRIGIKAPALAVEHMTMAGMEANLLQVQFANLQPNLWKSELYTVSLTPGTATYTLPVRVVTPQMVYISTTTSGITNDRVILPMSVTDYAGIANKTEAGAPVSYWFDRQTTPQITVWPVPDTSTTYTLALRMLAQSQDATIANGTSVDIPYRAYDAYVSGLAARLAQHFAPDRAIALRAAAKEDWQTFATEDRENVPLMIVPQMSGYYS